MIVQLTTGRWNCVWRHGPPACVEQMEVESQPNRKKVFVHAPYVGWELTKQALIERFITPTGFKRTGEGIAVGAIRSITTAQNAILRHPALRDKGMAGLQTEWFPVWREPEWTFIDINARRYSPRPRPNGEPFVVLAPVWTQDDVLGHNYTHWSHEGTYPVGHRLSVEATHLACLREDR